MRHVGGNPVNQQVSRLERECTSVNVPKSVLRFSYRYLDYKKNVILSVSNLIINDRNFQDIYLKLSFSFNF